MALRCLGEKTRVLPLTLSLPGDPCLILSLLNISTIRHVITCKNALKSVDSYLKTEYYLSVFTGIGCLGQLRHNGLIHINSTVILTSSYAKRKGKGDAFIC